MMFALVTSESIRLLAGFLVMSEESCLNAIETIREQSMESKTTKLVPS